VQLLFPLAPAETGSAAPDWEVGGIDEIDDSAALVPALSVLVVEDEDALRRLVERILAREGYHVTAARHGADALQIAATMQRPVDILITDLVMPELGGREVAERLRAHDPQLPVLFISGYDPDPVMLGTGEQERTGFLAKPFTGSALLDAVRRLAPLRVASRA
jgi:CheY-like chemotaxis protein